jgi:hypothetical protein
MRNIFVIILLSSFSIIVDAQINLDSLIDREKPKLIEPNHYPPKVNPDIYIKIDTANIKLDTISIKLIDPKWIKKVVILKKEKYKKLFGDSKPVLMIYPKKKYKNKISALFVKMYGT